MTNSLRDIVTVFGPLDEADWCNGRFLRGGMEVFVPVPVPENVTLRARSKCFILDFPPKMNLHFYSYEDYKVWSTQADPKELEAFWNSLPDADFERLVEDIDDDLCPAPLPSHADDGDD